jgi:ribosomal protein S1
MPPGCRCLVLPQIGEHVTGAVVWHVEHNHQVEIRLDAWAQHPDVWPEFVNRAGQIASGMVTKLASIGAFVRLGACVEGLIPRADLPLEYGTMLAEHQEVEVDPEGRKIRLAPA